MKTKVLVVLTLILASGTILLWLRNLQLKQQLARSPGIIEKVDTLYIDKPFTIDAPLGQVSHPEKITIYTRGLDKDTAHLLSDSLVQFKVTGSKLNLTLYNPRESLVSSFQYKLNLDNYQYLFANGQLTQKKKLNIKLVPYLQGKYRPIHTMFDVEGGLAIKIGKFYYGIGLDLGYYPKLSKELQKDVDVSVRYDF